MQLHQRYEDFQKRNTSILLVSFGTAQWADSWRDDTGVPFPLLLDPNREVYHTYGLDHSVRRVWNLSTFWYYLQQICAGRNLHGILGDPHQLGGDFVIDTGGRIRMAYRSREPTDRPTIDEILAHVPMSASKG